MPAPTANANNEDGAKDRSAAFFEAINGGIALADGRDYHISAA